MSQFGPKFIDKEININGPFNGCLVVLNINDNTTTSQEYRQKLLDVVSDAQANGYVVMHLFDAQLGIMHITDFLPYAEEHDFYMLISSAVDMQSADFSLVPSIRNQQIKHILESIFALPQFSFVNKKGAIIGKCKIDGDEVFIPYIEI